jgi:hypothetical protein
MLKRRLIQALLLGVPATATFSDASIIQAAEECRLKPDSTAPSGSRWVYRINRADHRHCWFLSSKVTITHAHLARRYRHLAGEPEAALPDQQASDSDLQTVFARPAKTDVAVAAKLSPAQAATPSTKQPSDDLGPRSIPTIVYRSPTAGAQTATASTVPAASVRAVTPAATNIKSNVVVLAGAAAAALCFAGAVFHFTRRVHHGGRLDTVADEHGGVGESVGGGTSVDAITSDLIEDVEYGLRDLLRDQQRSRETLVVSDETQDDSTVFLPHAAAWLSGPKTKSRTPENYQLADA